MGLGMVLTAGFAVVACGNSSAPPTSTAPTTSTSRVPTTAYDWLQTIAVPQNARLNTAQDKVVAASRSTAEESASTFFTTLGAACRSLRSAVSHARSVPPSPSLTLNSAWNTMLQATATYADDCLTLVKSHSTSDFTRWNSSLGDLNSANSALDTVVNTIRRTGSPAAGQG